MQITSLEKAKKLEMLNIQAILNFNNLLVQNQKGSAERTPIFQKQIGTPPAPELKPRAHLTGLDLEKIKCVPGEFPTVHWKYDQILQSKNTMKYENGSLVIPQHGDYFVYAQVTFRNHSTERKNCGPEIKMVTHVTQVILKHQSGYPVPIELLRRSSSIIKTQNWNHAIYLGAIASLQKNDKLLVNVSSDGLLYNRAQVNFFGAFLI
uniref:Uncharacterized protein n=1 Tax=Sphaerodactylus townsendi TaxID=933632 RepID=A0ACB8EZL7_9SAUR